MTGCQTHVKCLGDSVCDSRVFWPHTSRQSILYIVSSLYHLLKQSHRQGQRCEQDTDGFHWVWLQFQRAKVAVCIRCSCVQSTGKKALYQVLNTHVSAPKDKKAVSLKVVGPLYSCLFMAHLPSGSRTLNWHLKTIYSMPYSILLPPPLIHPPPPLSWRGGCRWLVQRSPPASVCCHPTHLWSLLDA